MRTSKNAGFLKMNKLKPLKELLSSYYAHFFKKKCFAVDGSNYCLTRFCRTFLMMFFMRNDQ